MLRPVDKDTSGHAKKRSRSNDDETVFDFHGAAADASDFV
jgi:hypothetical protein